MALGGAAALVASGPAGGEVEQPLISPGVAPYVSTQAALGIEALQEGAAGALRERAAELAHLRRAFVPGEEDLEGAAAERPQPINPVPGLFNADNLGVPQNEESVNACRANTNLVLGGTNDFRGFFGQEQEVGVTGWHFSNTSGTSLTNEGRLPRIPYAGGQLPSGGDPVVAIDETSCALYMVGLNFGFLNEETFGSAIGVYRSDAATLEQCGTGGVSEACWPTRRPAAATTQGFRFLDKPWADAGSSGPAGKVVWVTYTDFVEEDVYIRAVRCRGDLSACTAPITLHQAQAEPGSLFAFDQFSYVTIGTDGRVYVTWTEVQVRPDFGQVFRHRMRVAQPGSTSFGPARTIYTEDRPIPFGGFLHMADFRVATQPKNDVVMVDGRPRVFVTWDACQELILQFSCMEPRIKLTYSDDLGATWTTPRVVSVGGDNYFPSISRDDAGNLAIAYFTHRFDTAFHQRQDVELRRINGATGAPGSPRRLTPQSNEAEADPLLGGFFIGDYIQVFAHRGVAWTHYNANYRQVPFLGQSRPVNQQDNYLKRTGY